MYFVGQKKSTTVGYIQILECLFLNSKINSIYKGKIMIFLADPVEDSYWSCG